MAFKTLNHDDETLFCNRLWKLMEAKGLDKPKALALELYRNGIIPVDSNSKDGDAIVDSITRRIQEHLNQETTDKLQGRYVKAYCDYFKCSADYIFGNSQIKSGNIDIRNFCESSGLSEKAVQRLIEDLPIEEKSDLVGFWSKVLESNVFYGVPIEFRQMCYELGAYQTALNMIQKTNFAAKQMDASDNYVEAIRTMMEGNYQKEAQSHEGAYHMHLNEILVNISEHLELWAKEYISSHNESIVEVFFSDLDKRHRKSHDEFMKKNG